MLSTTSLILHTSRTVLSSADASAESGPLDFSAYDAALKIPGKIDIPIDDPSIRFPQVTAWRIPKQVQRAETAFNTAISNGTHCYINAERAGVGATTLAVRMVRRFNDLQQRQARAPRRTIWLSLAHKQAGPGKILDLLGHALQCPISASDLRLRAFNHIVAMLMEQATRMGIVGI